MGSREILMKVETTMSVLSGFRGDWGISIAGEATLWETRAKMMLRLEDENQEGWNENLAYLAGVGVRAGEEGAEVGEKKRKRRGYPLKSGFEKVRMFETLLEKKDSLKGRAACYRAGLHRGGAKPTVQGGSRRRGKHVGKQGDCRTSVRKKDARGEGQRPSSRWGRSQERETWYKTAARWHLKIYQAERDNRLRKEPEEK